MIFFEFCDADVGYMRVWGRVRQAHNNQKVERHKTIKGLVWHGVLHLEPRNSFVQFD